MARVLVAEPSADVRMLLMRTVRQAGYEPIRYVQYDHHRLPTVDVLLLEPALVGGPALVTRLRREQPGIAVVLCTIFPRAPHLSELGAVAHVVKPFAREELERALRTAVAAAAAARAA